MTTHGSDREKNSTKLFNSKADTQPGKSRKDETLIVGLVEQTLTSAWLANRTEDELIQIIGVVSDELRKRRNLESSTERIAKQELPSEFREVTDVPLSEYRALPRKSDELSIADDRTWYILLISSDAEQRPLALKVMGDVVFGRTTEGANPDVDLTDYGADANGISRMHAMLRPLPDQLIISDLGSTNGTEFNGERLSLGKPRTVSDKGVLTLGRLHFQVRIMHKPGEPVS